MITLRDLTDKKGFITTKKVLYADIMPWLTAAFFGMVIYYGLAWLLADFNSGWTANAKVSQYELFGLSLASISQLEVVKYGVILIACILARRSAALSTWLLVIAVMLAWPFLKGMTPAAVWFPHSPVPEIMMIAGLLALGRLSEYLYMRHSADFTSVTLANGAALAYSILALVTILLNSHIAWMLLM
ncbi:MAG: hypothetical protein Q4B06_04025 [Candidatus Saccharibacteria bacterium]|nr:hypothetical protein [Candidatus Saccharibacteria bacterium]